MRFYILVLLCISTVAARRIDSSKNHLRALEKDHIEHLVFEGDEPIDPALDKLISVIEATEEEENTVSSSVEDHGQTCWSYCDQGTCKWTLKGCKCQCNANFVGKCCTEMKQCGPGTEKCCPRKNLNPTSKKCSDLAQDVEDGNTLVLGTADMGLPKDRQGLFWLTKQGAKSSLMSFANTNDGCGIAKCSGDQCEGSFTKDNPFRIRVAGDRTWSDGGGFESGTFKAAAALDLVYNFFEESPGKMVIVPQITRSFFNIKFARWLMEFRADRLEHDKVNEHKSPYTTTADGKRNSFVWRRSSNAMFGNIDLGGAASYDLVQVLDGEGKKLQPAYDDFVESCSKEESSWEKDHDATKYKGGATEGKRTVYGRGVAEAANDEYYFRVAKV